MLLVDYATLFCYTYTILFLYTTLHYIYTGKTVRADKARKIGLIDLVVDEYALESVAIQQAQGLINKSVKLNNYKSDWLSYFLTSNPLGQYIMYSNTKKTVDKATGMIYDIYSAYVYILYTMK